ncbi:MAG: MATE family efflux transporter, partial [Armatimonadota bacterium]
MSIGYIKNRWHEPCGYKEILNLAWPLVLSTCSVTIQQFINRIFLTWYSSESLAAATPAGAISFLAMCLPIGIVGYVSTFIAQYHGAGMSKKIAGCVWQSIYLSIFFSVLVLCILPYSDNLFALTKHTPNLIRLETAYFNIIVGGSFFAICGSAVSGFFMGLGKTRVLLGVNILATAVNIILDYLLIFGNLGFPEMGISGAALGTVISSAVSLIALLILLFRKENRDEYNTHTGWQFNSKLIKRMIKYGFPNGMQLSIDVFIWSVFLLFVGRLG